MTTATKVTSVRKQVESGVAYSFYRPWSVQRHTLYPWTFRRAQWLI